MSNESDYKTIAQAKLLSPGNPSEATVWRWCRKGISSKNGERSLLRHVRVGGKIYTKQNWLDEFFAAIAAADMKHFQGIDNKKQ